MQSILFGNYQLYERINTGMKTAVYRATRMDVEGVERLVAVKRLLPDFANDPNAASELLDEAKISMQLTHGNIAQVLESGEIEGTPFIATEFVDGKELGEIFDRVLALGQRLPIPFACHTIIKLCEGLSYIHDKKSPSGSALNLVHGNISPRNILISYDGEVKIIDMGTARKAGSVNGVAAGTPDGTLGYMSPEQVQGIELDLRSDVFNVGICFYELITGERLYSDDDEYSAFQKIRDAQVSRFSDINPLIPSELEGIVLRALARDRDERYQTALELHDELQAFMYSNGYSYSRKEMSAYLRELFSEEIDEEYLSSDPTRVAPDQKPGEDTGLIAFEDIEPVSTVSALIVMPDMSVDSSENDDSLSVPVEIFPDQEVTPAPAAYPESAYPRDQEVTPIPPSYSADNFPAASMASAPPAQKRSLPPLAGGAPSPWSTPSDSEAASPYSRLDPTPLDAFGSQLTPTPPPSPIPPRQVTRPPSAPALSSLPPPPFKSPVSIPPSLASLGMDFDSDDEATRVYDASLKYSAPLVPSLARSAGPVYPADSPFAPPVSGQTRPMQPIQESAFASQEWESNKKPMKLVLTSVIVAAALGIGGFLVLKKPSPGVLNVSTTPEDATVTMDGLPVSEGSSPFVISSVEPNTAHQIEVSKAGYQSWSTTVELKPSQTLNIPKVILEQKKTETGFSVDSSPTQADVYLDGNELKQKTPLRIVDLSPGMHSLRIQKGGDYIPWETQIQIPENQVLELSRITLDRKPERREQRQIAREASKERTSRAVEKVTKPTRRATTASPRRSTRRSTRTPRPPVVRQPTLRRASAQPKSSGTGTLRVNTRPWSQVFVDNRLIGNTPQMNIQLPSGKHTVTFVSPTFGIRKNITVKIGAGKTVTKVLTLSPGG